MITAEQEVLARLGQWLAAGRPAWLCTIVRATGSSPRPVGSLMACTAEGETVGSVSGGCLEEDLLQRISDGEFAGSRPELIEFGVSAEENERLGLPCGGRLTLLIEKLPPGSAEDWIPTLVDALADRRITRRRIDLHSGRVKLEPATEFLPLELSENGMSQCFGPRMRLLLVGAGQLSQSLSELALAMDYEVLVTDPRREFLEHWTGPAVRLVGGMPDDAVRDHAGDAHSIVITLTHDPRIDDMALMEALESEAWYVGALGSHRTTQKRLERLRQLEIPESCIARLHAPVGLDIGSKTPLEIAVAIMAELTALRRRPPRAAP